MGEQQVNVLALGVWLSTDPNIIISLNYNEKIDKIRSILECWKFCRLTLLGKIAVLKGLVASQLVYIFSLLQTNREAIKEINTIFCKFLWNDKGDKIKRKIMINNYSEGGLKMIDIASFNKSLRATWIQKYLDPESRSKWKRLFDSELKRNGGEAILKENLNKKDDYDGCPFRNSHSVGYWDSC